MSAFDPKMYGPVFAPLIDTDRRRPLDAGTPRRDARSALEEQTVETAFSHAQIADRDMAACCLSAVWLLHDDLDESHSLSQQIETPSGSFWHGIMHRREGDFSNAKYWFRRVGGHAVFDALSQRAAEIAAVRGEERALKKLITAGAWDACAFVDLVESVVRGQGSTRDLCLDIQQAEWELLFDHCYRAAIGE
jgi:hypothetical protein